MFDFGKNLFRERTGSSMIMVSIAMVSLIGFCSLVLDMGNLFLARNRLNNALDASVLAACQELPDTPATAGDVVEEYFTSHGYDISALTNYHVSEDKRKVTATGRVTVQYFLARILGIESSTVNCTAAAKILPLTAVKGIVPIGIKNQELEFGKEYELKIASNNNFNEYLGPGNFGVLQLSGSGSSSYEECFMYGYDSTIRPGDILPTESGNMSGATRDGIDYRVDQCTHACTPEDFEPSCPRVIIIPVYEAEEVQNNKVNSVKVVGFATFLLTPPGEKPVGNDSFVIGHFVQMTLEGEGDENAADYGAYTVKLIV